MGLLRFVCCKQIERTTKTEEKMEIESPYENEVDSFNNIDSFPDLEFVVPGMEHPLLLHKKDPWKDIKQDQRSTDEQPRI